MKTPHIVLENVSKRFGSLCALDRVSLTVQPNEVVCIIGPSGSGKTTLLRTLAGLEQPDEGTVRVTGKPVMVLQHSFLWPHKTVLENVVLALLKVKQLDKIQAEQKAISVLSKLGLENRLNAFPEMLSGGEIQRVAIARALVLEPDVLLLDEITSALDPLLVGEMIQTIRQLACDKRTLVLVTHQLDFAKEISDRVIMLDEGKIIEDGHAFEVFASPRHAKTKQFVAKIKNV